MKRRLLYVILIPLLLYLMYLFLIPKYYFTSTKGTPKFRCNRITGSIKYVRPEATNQYPSFKEYDLSGLDELEKKDEENYSR